MFVSQLRNTFLNTIVGKTEEPSLPEDSSWERERAIKSEEGEDGASAGHERNQQSILTRDTRTHTQTHGIVKAWLSRCGAACLRLCVWICVCVFLSVIKRLKMETEDVRTIPLSVFTLSLNSRPATEANGVLIYSWMTHTCRPLSLSNRQVTSLCHIYNMPSLFQWRTLYTFYCKTHLSLHFF